MLTHQYTISNADTGKRLDIFFTACLPNISREKIKKAIQDGCCTINNIVVHSPSTRLKLGQNIELTLEQAAENLIAEAGEIDLIWHDADIAVCNKPAGITVHPCPSCPSGTYIQRVASHFPTLLKQEGLRPGIVHRLDKDTSGLMLIALTEAARLRLSEDFALRRVQKTYLALVHGLPPKEGEIKEPIGRHPQVKVKMAIVEQNHGGREAHSIWKRLYADPEHRFSLIEISILTGRTHQIRVHMAHLGYALWGDKVYGSKEIMKHEQDMAQRQMLHAWKINFSHPQHNNALSFCIPPPHDMLECALNLSVSLQKIIIVGLPGSGKSTILQIFNEKNIPTFSADATVKKLYSPGAAGHNYFLKRFGKTCIAHPKAEVNREVLRELMQDTNIRQEVNSFIHTLVYEELENFWKICQENGHIFAVAEIPLYLENGRPYTKNTHIIGLKCNQMTRYNRLQNERKWSEEQCHSMDSWQWAEEKKLSACDTIIDNSKNIVNLDSCIDNILEQLKTKLDEAKIKLTKHLQKLWQ